MLPDEESSDALRKVHEATLGLVESQLVLRQTVCAIRRQRRTPYQIAELRARSEELRHVSRLIRRFHARLLTVH